MKTFKQYISEAKNVHLLHIDQSLLIDGDSGVKTTVNFLESLIDMLSGGTDGALKIGLKWDGAPGLIAGIEPESGRFFVGTKSTFSKKVPKVNFTNEDIDKFHGGQGELPDKLKLALKLLPKIWKGKGVFQGDLMFTPDQKFNETIDGQSLLMFRPNSIAYAVPSDSDLGKQINAAKLGIAMHTRYTGKTLSDMSASYDVTKNEFKENKDVWFDDANLTDIGGALFSKTETKYLNSLLKSLKAIVGKSKFAINKLQKNSKGIVAELVRFDNNEIKKGFVIKNSKKYFNDFIVWLVNEKKTKLKSFNEAKEKALRNKLNSERKDWEFVIEFIAQTIVIKEQVVTQLNKIKQLKTFAKTDSGFVVVGQEGFTAISDGKIVKLVDRLEFTKNLFTTAKDWDAGEKPK
jgi:hypothetical protein|tara:strand:+ start:1542 stop:2753 length:1212 start_codon:yes stop_codon:yes gene_type:complete